MRSHEFVNQHIKEVKMSPSRLGKFISGSGTSLMAGFEIEAIFPGNPTFFDVRKPLPESISIPMIEQLLDMTEPQNFHGMQRLEQEYEKYVTKKRNTFFNDPQTYNKALIAVKRVYPEVKNPKELEELVFDEMEYQWDDPTLYEFLDGKTWEEIETWYGLVFKGKSQMYTLKDTFQPVVNSTVKVLTAYHGEEKNTSIWYIEPDSSIKPPINHYGAEIVSPVMPINKMLNMLDQSLAWARAQGGTTNNSTGLHISISAPGVDLASDLDYLKLVVFLGDNHVLAQFQRTMSDYAHKEDNYAESALEQVMAKIGKLAFSEENAKSYISPMRKFAMATIELLRNNDKYTSVNFKQDKNYVEFRAMGNDYINRFGDIKTVVARYAKALTLAITPDAASEEYAAKIAKLFPTRDTDLINLFIKYSLGIVGFSTLKYAATKLANNRKIAPLPKDLPAA